MISSRLLGREGPGASSYSMFISFSAFSTLQHAPVLSHSSLQRWSLTGIRPPLVDRTDPTHFEPVRSVVAQGALRNAGPGELSGPRSQAENHCRYSVWRARVLFRGRWAPRRPSPDTEHAS